MAGKYVYHVSFVREPKAGGNFMFGEVTIDSDRPLVSQKDITALRASVAKADDSSRVIILSLSLLSRDGLME